MKKNAKNVLFEEVMIFGGLALLTDNNLDISTIPKELYCYELNDFEDNGIELKANRYTCFDDSIVYIISTEPLKPVDIEDKIKENIMIYLGRYSTLNSFIENKRTINYSISIAGEYEAMLFFSQRKSDLHMGCIGHLRIDFGFRGEEFWHTWYDHRLDLKSVHFQKEFQMLIDDLRHRGPLKNLPALTEFCKRNNITFCRDENCKEYYKFRVETSSYRYYIRCMLSSNDYNIYIYCYNKERIINFLSSDLNK